MTLVAPEHVDADHEEGMPDKGRALVRHLQLPDGSSGPMVWFRCPRDRLYCGVPAKPTPANSRGCSWDLTGPSDAPTLSPSVNCDTGCGWHGYIKNGATEGV